MRQEIEVMRVLRVPPLGKLVVEVNGKRYEMLNEVDDAPGKRRLLAAVGELITFADGYNSLVDAGVAPPIVTEAPATPPVTAEEESLKAEQARFLEELEKQRDALKLKAGVSTEPAVVSLPPEKTEPPPPRPKTSSRQSASVASQIDTILQSLKAEDPKLAERPIRLRQNPAGGLHIEVDGQVYKEPSEIEDGDVRKLIRRAVQIWRSD